MNVIQLADHKWDRNKYTSEQQRLYATARMTLTKWTIVHETNGNKFELSDLNMTILRQEATRGEVCNAQCCRLWKSKGDLCHLHNIESKNGRQSTTGYSGYKQSSECNSKP